MMSVLIITLHRPCW